MKILALDIETRPATVYTWSLWQPIIGIDQIIDPGGMLCFAAKWLGERKTEFHAAWDKPSPMVQRLHTLLNDADAVLHFNGSSFDVPHIQREFMEAGMTPPAPFKQIDLLRTVKRQGRFLSNKLAHVGPQLGLKGKVEHEGFMLWRKVMDGDEGARRRMRKYNIRDVTLLEEAYEILRPWVVGHPSHAALRGERVCTRCGGADLERRGYATLTTGRYARLHCKGCGAWSRETKREIATDVVAL